MRVSTFRWSAGALLASTLLLTGCSAVVPMTPEANSKDVACANVTVRLPEVVGGATDANGNANSVPLPRRETNAQGTGAWGEPAAVLLWCGAKALGPSTLPCVTVNGVDWIIDDSNAPSYRFTTFGRTPVVTVVVDSARASGSTVLADLSGAVGATAQTDHCLG